MAGETGEAFSSADKLLTELAGGAMSKDPSPAATMGRLAKVRYTHEAMIEFILTNGGKPPEERLTQGQIAAHFGYTEGWISNILAADAFQAALAARRAQIMDPEIVASIEERFKALTIQSLKVLQTKLTAPVVSDQVALRCAELGAKALGVGGHGAPKPQDTGADRLERLAHRLISLQAGVRERVIDGQAEVVQPAQAV